MSTEQTQYEAELDRHREWLINQQLYLQQKVETFEKTGEISSEEWEEEEEREEFDDITYKNDTELTLSQNSLIFRQNRRDYLEGNVDNLQKYVPFPDGFETKFPKAVALYKQKDEGPAPN